MRSNELHVDIGTPWAFTRETGEAIYNGLDLAITLSGLRLRVTNSCADLPYDNRTYEIPEHAVMSRSQKDWQLYVVERLSAPFLNLPGKKEILGYAFPLQRRLYVATLGVTNEEIFATTAHEAGHMLGVRANIDQAQFGHCPDASCLLYSKIDYPNTIATGISSSFQNSHASFCGECEADLRDNGMANVRKILNLSNSSS